MTRPVPITRGVWLLSLPLFLLLALPALADLADPGPLSTGFRTVTVTRPNNSTFTARLHYPAIAPGGQNAPLQPSSAVPSGYPAISFGHGFLQAVTQYQSTGQHLASHGFLVIASESEGSLSPSHANFAADLRYCLTWLEQQSADPTSFLYQQVDTAAFGLCGHSMGAGCSLLAAAADPRIRCVANMAAAETTPSAITACASIMCPVFLITGSQDSIVAPASNGQAMYNALTTARQLPLITGGFHCGFTDNTFLFCDSGAITRAQQLAITRRLLTSFFLLHLVQADTLWSSVWGPQSPPSQGVTLTRDAGVTVNASVTALDAPPGGRSQPFSVTITNTSGQPCAYTVSVESPDGWTGLDTPSTGTLAPGAVAIVPMRIRAPGLAGAAQTTLLISAASDVEIGPRGWTSLPASRRICPVDWNGVGGVTIQDIFDFLNDYFDHAADFNGISGTSVQDVFDFLAMYFDSCP